MISYDPRSPVPPYEQVRAQLARQVQAGELTPGTRLPTVRRLAGDLGLAVNTVARAYRELERYGLVVTRGRHGTAVAAGPDEAVALDAAADYAARARGLGLTTQRALELVRGVLEASDPGPTGPAGEEILLAASSAGPSAQPVSGPPAEHPVRDRRRRLAVELQPDLPAP